MLNRNPNIESRQIVAVDTLWKEIIFIGNLLPAYVDILTEEEYLEGSWLSTMQTDPLADYLEKTSSTIEEVRLYLPDQLWNSFFIARSLVGRICGLVFLALNGQPIKCHWTNDRMIQDLLTAFFTKEEYKDWERLPVFSKLQMTWERLGYKILCQCRNSMDIEFEPKSLSQDIFKIGFQSSSPQNKVPPNSK